MKQTSFIIILIATLTIGLLSINSGIIFTQGNNETSEFDESSALITTKEIDESMETNNTLSQMTNNTPIIK